MERYAVLNVGSCEIISQWYVTEAEAHAAAAESESHETQPECSVVLFSEWADGKPLAMIAGTEAWDGAYPVVDSDLDMTGEIVSAQDQGYTVTACGMAVTRDADVIAEKIEQIEKALGPARASRTNPSPRHWKLRRRGWETTEMTTNTASLRVRRGILRKGVQWTTCLRMWHRATSARGTTAISRSAAMT
jgi:hypothetical protein